MPVLTRLHMGNHFPICLSVSLSVDPFICPTICLVPSHPIPSNTVVGLLHQVTSVSWNTIVSTVIDQNF